MRCVMEQIVQAFRVHKKYIEKRITLSVNRLTMMKKKNDCPEQILKGINEEIANMTTLKHKYTKLTEEEDSFWSHLETRVHNLVDLEEQTVPQPNKSEKMNSFFALKLDRTILDFMLRQGYFTTAKLFAQQKGILEFSDLPVFAEIRRIKTALEQDQNCVAAL